MARLPHDVDLQAVPRQAAADTAPYCAVSTGLSSKYPTPQGKPFSDNLLSSILQRARAWWLRREPQPTRTFSLAQSQQALARFTTQQQAARYHPTQDEAIVASGIAATVQTGQPCALYYQPTLAAIPYRIPHGQAH